MRPGKVIYIRLNPQDCMSIVDIVDKLRIPTANMSFALAAKLAISSMLESFRANGVIPIRDGFEYTQLLSRFTDTKANRAAKLARTTLVEGLGESYQAPALVPEANDRKRRRLRFQELRFRQVNDPANWSDADQAEFKPLVEEFFDELFQGEKQG